MYKIELKKSHIEEVFLNVIVLNTYDSLLAIHIREHGNFYSKDSKGWACEYLPINHGTILCTGVRPIKEKIGCAGAALNGLRDVRPDLYKTIEEQSEIYREIRKLIKKIEKIEEMEA